MPHLHIYAQSKRDPVLAHNMSLVLPGLGQLYNKEQRKASIFLIAGGINYAVMAVLIFAPFILDSVKKFAAAYDVKLNSALVSALMQVQFGSAASLALLALFLLFAIFSAADARDRATYLERKAIYLDQSMALPEAAGSSYIFHVSMLIACGVLAFFFLIPAPPREQVIEFEFKSTQDNTREKVQSRVKADNNARAGGVHNFKLPTTIAKNSTSSSSSSSSANSSSSRSSAKPKSQAVSKANALESSVPAPLSKPVLRPVLRPVSSSAPIAPLRTSAPEMSSAPPPLPQLMPTPIPTPMQMAKKAVPLPVVSPVVPRISSSAPVPLAMPNLTGRSTIKLPAALRPPAGETASSQTAGAAAPVKIASAAGSDQGPTLAPRAASTARSSNSSSSSSSDGGPSPVAARSRSNGNGPGLALLPSVHGSRDTGSGPSSSSSSPRGAGGNDDNHNPAGGPRDGTHDATPVDFGPYMADLQRRIKRAWFPPHVGRSKRIRVIFKLSRDGRLQNLRMATSSGLEVADQAALKAVENAAPFLPLPKGSPEDVDIEFTFDYNVFNGGGSGSFRNF